jgi:HlyD family secretion protein
MTARVTINVGESKNVLVVPLSAIKEEKGQKYVRSIVNGQMQNISVRTGLTNDENVEILSGLTEGVQIVLPTIKASTTSTTKNQGPPPPI